MFFFHARTTTNGAREIFWIEKRRNFVQKGYQRIAQACDTFKDHTASYSLSSFFQE
jgi:hypothetical protein